MQGLTKYTQGEVFHMSEMPVKLGKVEIDGLEWNKIVAMLEEREKFLRAKAILVETRYRSEGNTTYQCLSEDELTKSLSAALQKADKMEKEHPIQLEEAYQRAEKSARLAFSEEMHTLKTKIAELRLELEKEKTFSDKLLQRGLWRRVFNKRPKVSNARLR